MATNAILILALILQGVYSQTQDHGTSEATSSGVTISVEGTGRIGVPEIMQNNAVQIPGIVAGMGVRGAQLGVDTVRQFFKTLFGSDHNQMGSGFAEMFESQPAWNLNQQGLSVSGEGAAQGTESANQMMSGIISFMNQPHVMTILRQMVDSGVLTQGEDKTVIIDVTKLPTNYVNYLTSVFGTSKDGTITVDLSQPGPWVTISTLINRGMSLSNDAITMGMDAAKMPIDLASQTIDMVRHMIPGQSANSGSINAALPALSLGSFKNSFNPLATNSAQLTLDAMQHSIEAANNDMEVTRDIMRGSGTDGGSSSVTINSGGTESSGQGESLLMRTGMSGSTNGLGSLVKLAENSVNLGLDTAGLGFNVAGRGIDRSRNLLTSFLGTSHTRPYVRPISGGLRTPWGGFSTRTEGF